MTNPTVNNIFEAGRYGKTSNDRERVGRIADDDSLLWSQNASSSFILLLGLTISIKARVAMHMINIQKLSITRSMENSCRCRNV